MQSVVCSVLFLLLLLLSSVRKESGGQLSLLLGWK